MVGKWSCGFSANLSVVELECTWFGLTAGVSGDVFVLIWQLLSQSLLTFFKLVATSVLWQQLSRRMACFGLVVVWWEVTLLFHSSCKDYEIVSNRTPLRYKCLFLTRMLSQVTRLLWVQMKCPEHVSSIHFLFSPRALGASDSTIYVLSEYQFQAALVSWAWGFVLCTCTIPREPTHPNVSGTTLSTEALR